MSEAEALRFFLKLVCASALILIATAWALLGILHLYLRRHRVQRDHDTVKQLSHQ